MSTHDYDVLVLGGGSAGTSAATAAADAGARTAVVNDGELGGLCILRGCMPTKGLLASAHAVHEPTLSDGFGVRFEGRMVPNFTEIMARKDRLVERFQRAKVDSVESGPYELLRGRGRFARGGREGVAVAVDVDGRRVTARSVVVATGSEPTLPPIEGMEDVPVLTSDDVMRLESPPRSLMVLGAGPVGLELAQFFARLGTRVLLVNRSHLLASHDVDCGAELLAALSEEMDFAVPARIRRLRPSSDGLVATLESEDGTTEHEAEAILVATGRHALLDGLGLEHVGLEIVHGIIKHDDHMRTSNPHVYVAGDATGAWQVLHLANQEGRVAGRNAAGVDPAVVMDYSLHSSVVFTDPPFAQVGLTPVGAELEGRPVVIGEAHFPSTGRAITMEVRHGRWKLLADPETRRILGSVLVGPRADDLVHLVAELMYFGGRVDDVAELPWYHPTLSEVMLNLGRDLSRKLPAVGRMPEQG